MEMTATTVLTKEFWSALSDDFDSMPRTDIGNWLESEKTHLADYSALTYGELPLWKTLEQMTDSERSVIVFMNIGDAFARIYDALSIVYNPLENYYSNRTYNENSSGSNTRSGKVIVTPTGGTKTETGGNKERTYTNHGTTGQGTTFDNTSDFRNISKDISDGSVKDTFTNYGTETTYKAGTKTETNYSDVKDDASGERHLGEHREGNSGIFSKQDLLQREINLRQKNKIVPILVRMVVDVLNTGVYSSDD